MTDLVSLNAQSQDSDTSSARDYSLLTLENLNPNIQEMQYEVRGPIVARANELINELKNGVTKPFKEVIRVNIGDSHAVGQPPITFVRQVVATACFPPLTTCSVFPDDVTERAELLLSHCRGGSVGSYSDSAGIEFVRRHVAEFIAKRDGFPCNWEDIILSDGASMAIKSVMKLFIYERSGLKSGVMVPIPQYPLYSATITEFNLHLIGYYLDESRGWSLDVEELKEALSKAKNVCIPRAIVVINPGNPTGQLLSKKNIQEIIKFAYDSHLLLLADEVYQYNVHDKNSEFHSFKKVMMEMGPPYCFMELASFNSCSKGYMGECGLRSGYAEVINFDSKVKAMFMKSITVLLCPNVLGQIAMDCMVKPPEPGEPSHELFVKEKETIRKELAEKAKFIEDTINSIEGMSCNPVQGAMYAFPRIYLPPLAEEIAKKKKLSPDAYYAFELLEETGVCVVPGSGFGQQKGTFHFRTTILPQMDILKEMMAKLKVFHMEFLKKHQFSKEDEGFSNNTIKDKCPEPHDIFV